MRWKLKEFERSIFTVFEVIDENDEVIKTFVADDITYSEKKKKAQLMAAAPELLEAAESIKRMIEVYREADIFTKTNDFKKLGKAINKAKGADE